MRFILSFFILFISVYASGQEMWQGQSLPRRMLIRLAPDSLGRLAAFFTLPESRVHDAQADSLAMSGDEILAVSRNHGIRLQGRFTGNRDSLHAMVTVYRDTMRMNMGRTDSLRELFFPQNPQPPYPYIVEEISYSSPDSITFGATLTLPAGAGPFPAAIIVSGTGKQDRDGNFGGRRPFHLIADYLTRRGYAVLRVDDRGTGRTTGVYEDATTRDFMNDALVGIEYLKNRPEIDPSRVGVIGHSEGGLVALMLGARPGAVSFVVSLAGVGVSGLEILTLQNEAILSAMPGFTSEKVDATMSLYNHLFRTVYDTPADTPLDAPLRESLAQWMAQQDEQTLKLADVDNGRDQMFIGRYIYSADRAWYREMIMYDPADYIPCIKVPVLALNGNRDVNVPAAQNLASIRRLLEHGGNRNFSVMEIDGLNHMFQRAVTGTNGEASQLEEVFSDRVLEIIYDWLDSNFNRLKNSHPN